MGFRFAGRSYDTTDWSPTQGRIGNILALTVEAKTRETIRAWAYSGHGSVWSISLKHLHAFLVAHEDALIAMHGAAGGLRLLTERTGFDFDAAIRSQRLVDVGIEYRLLKLATIGEIPSQHDLGALTDAILGIGLDRHRAAIGAPCNPLIIFRLFEVLHPKVRRLSPDHLLSHKIQVMGEIGLDQIERNGIRIDVNERRRLLVRLNRQRDQGQPSMRQKADILLRFVTSLDQARMHTHFRSIGSTGRVSSRAPNLQNIPRRGGIRALFIPSEGYRFIIADYAQLELCTLAQACFDLYGRSKMRDLINQGVDLHQWFASIVIGKPTAAISKDSAARRAAKACNFGFPGGLGVRAFLDYSKKHYGVLLTEDRANAMKERWLNAFPEMHDYLQGNSEQGEAVTTRTGRIRAHASYCAARNTPFQGLAADGAKIALYRLVRANYRLVHFIHDEVIIEVPASCDLASAQAEIEEIMVEAMRVVVPDVAIRVVSRIAARWGTG